VLEMDEDLNPYKETSKPYAEVQDLLRRFISEGDPDEVVFLFEKAFDKVVSQTAFYNSEKETVEFMEDMLCESWFNE